MGTQWLIDSRWFARAYVSGVYSQMKSVSVTSSDIDAASLPPELRAALQDSDLDAWSVAPTVSLHYDRWWGARRFQLDGFYTFSYTDTFDASSSVLDTSGFTNTMAFRATFTAPTGLRVFDMPITWHAYADNTTFLPPDRDALGFSTLFQLGGGLELDVSTNVLGLFFVKYVGFRATYIIGDDVEGNAFYVTFRY